MTKRQESRPPGLPMWMATYADMVTLLLTFFVALLSMADLDKAKYEKARGSIKDAFGFQATTPPTRDPLTVLPMQPRTRFMPIQQQTALQVYKKVKEEMEKTRLNQDADLVQRDGDTVVLSIREGVLFEPGKAVISPTAFPVLRKVADVLRPLPMQLRIEGHTDNTPLASGTLNNWDLSVARAVAVLGFFQRNALFPLDRMAAVGYGELRPAVPNDSDENRAHNRRVEFVLRSGRIPGGGASADPPL